MEKSKNGTPRDDLVADLKEIISESTDWKMDIKEETLMEKLVIYITRRDHKVHNHAYNLGKEQHENKNIEATE